MYVNFLGNYPTPAIAPLNKAQQHSTLAMMPSQVSFGGTNYKKVFDTFLKKIDWKGFVEGVKGIFKRLIEFIKNLQPKLETANTVVSEKIKTIADKLKPVST